MLDLDGDSKFNGVGGWLLFFCFTLVFFRPGALIAWSLMGHAQWMPLFQQAPVAAWVGLLTEIVWKVFGIYLGYSIYILKPKSIRWTKNYLWAEMILSLIGARVRPWALRTIAYDIIWLLYLYNSRQVKERFMVAES